MSYSNPLIFKVTDIEVLRWIHAHVSQANFIECGRCQSVKVEARSLVKELAKDLPDEVFAIADELSDILAEALQFVPDEYRKDVQKWSEWEASNDYRRCDFLESHGYEYTPFLKAEAIIIKSPEFCDCFDKE